MRATQQFTDPDDSEGEAFDWGAINSDALPSPTTPIIPRIPVFHPPDDSDDANLRTPVNDPPPLQVPVQQPTVIQSNSSIHSTMRSTSASAQLIAFAPVISVSESDAPDPASTISAGLASLVIAPDAVDPGPGLPAPEVENQRRRGNSKTVQASRARGGRGKRKGNASVEHELNAPPAAATRNTRSRSSNS
ncbi:hypothetical protein H0H92_010123 [Tricholoma furcatifolium]|nr:hypothetical protein H0H92_010123 [Tricholoma furcatifolium]